MPDKLLLPLSRLQATKLLALLDAILTGRPYKPKSNFEACLWRKLDGLAKEKGWP